MKAPTSPMLEQDSPTVTVRTRAAETRAWLKVGEGTYNVESASDFDHHHVVIRSYGGSWQCDTDCEAFCFRGHCGHVSIAAWADGQHVPAGACGVGYSVTAASVAQSNSTEQPSEAAPSVAEPSDTAHVAAETSGGGDAAVDVRPGQLVRFRTCGREQEGTVKRPHERGDRWFLEVDGHERCVLTRNIIDAA